MSSTNIDKFISIVGFYEIDPLDAAAFAKLAADSIDRTLAEDGCLYYIVAQDIKRPNVFHLSEGWASTAALDKHGRDAGFKDMLEQAFKLRILKREIYFSESTGRTLLA